MKKLLFMLSLLWAAGMQAQQYARLWQGAESVRVQQGDILFSDGGQTIAFGGQQYATHAVDSITIVKTIFVSWSQAGAASVVIPQSAQAHVTATIDGGHVTLTNTNVQEEMEFVLAGKSTDGSLTYNGQYKCKFHLAGLDLTSTRGAALDIQCGKRIDLILTDGTQNTLTDAVGGTHKAALNCKGHMEVAGRGSLTVAGRSRHAIATKEYLLLKASTGNITIKEAASDALHVGQYFQMNGGNLLVDENTRGDGLQVDRTDDATDELNGQILIKGGTIRMTIAGQDCKGIKTGAELPSELGGDITITGGTINIAAKGNGSRGIQSDANMLISDTDGPTAITIAAQGARCTQPDCADDPHRCMGIKVDGTLTVAGGTTTVTNTGSKSRGIKCTSYRKMGGTVTATVTYDNLIN